MQNSSYSMSAANGKAFRLNSAGTSDTSRKAQKKAERFCHPQAVLGGPVYAVGETGKGCVLGEKPGCRAPLYPLLLRSLETFMAYLCGGPCKDGRAEQFLFHAAKLYAPFARMKLDNPGWLRRWASEHTPELFATRTEWWFAQQERRAMFTKMGDRPKPDDMAIIYDIQEWHLEECFGPNRRRRGGLVSVDRPKHVREAERRSEWAKAQAAERKRRERRRKGMKSWAERTAQAQADREQAEREGVTVDAIKKRRQRAAKAMSRSRHESDSYNEVADTTETAAPDPSGADAQADEGAGPSRKGERPSTKGEAADGTAKTLFALGRKTGAPTNSTGADPSGCPSQAGLADGGDLNEPRRRR